MHGAEQKIADTDAAVAALEKLGAQIKRNPQGEIYFVSLNLTQVTDVGVTERAKALPNCKIER